MYNSIIVVEDNFGTCFLENKVYPNCTKKESWDETSPGGIRTQTCPGNSIGVVSRTCSSKGEWMQPVDGCVRKEIETISLQVFKH